MKLIKCIAQLHEGIYSCRVAMYARCLMLGNRYNKQQKFGKAIHLLHSGAVSLMQHEQYASGSDLANYMLDTYNTANLEVDETSLGKKKIQKGTAETQRTLTNVLFMYLILCVDRVVELLSLYPADEPGRKSFIQNAFRYTHKHTHTQKICMSSSNFRLIPEENNSWTRKHGQYQEGDPELHDYVGTMFYHGK